MGKSLIDSFSALCKSNSRMGTWYAPWGNMQRWRHPIINRLHLYLDWGDELLYISTCIYSSFQDRLWTRSFRLLLFFLTQINYWSLTFTFKATDDSDGKPTTKTLPFARSFSFNGRTRHTTFTRHVSLSDMASWLARAAGASRHSRRCVRSAGGIVGHPVELWGLRWIVACPRSPY